MNVLLKDGIPLAVVSKTVAHLASFAINSVGSTYTCSLCSKVDYNDTHHGVCEACKRKTLQSMKGND